MNERAVNRVYDTVFIACIAVSVVLCLIPFIHIIAVSLSGTTPITSGKVSLSAA